MSASTPESLVRFQSLEDQVVNLTKRIDALRSENIALKRSSAKSEKDAHEFVAYFQREMEKKDALISQLKQKLATTQEDLNYERQQGQKEHQAKLSEIKAEYAAANKKLQLRLDVAEDELTVLGEFKSVKADLLSKLNAAREELEAERRKHKEELSALERKSIEEKTRLRKEQETQIREIKKRSREEAQQGLSADTRKLITDNKRMGEELRFQLQTSDELERERDRLTRENVALKREHSLNVEKEAEYAKQGFKKEKQLRAATDSVRSLEKSLSNIVQQFEKEKHQMEESHKTQLEELDLECNGLRSLVRLKNKELKHIRSLAQEILDQRTELEEFFTSALAQVKQEKLEAAHARYQNSLRQQRINQRVNEHKRKQQGIASEDAEFLQLSLPTSKSATDQKGTALSFPRIGSPGSKTLPLQSNWRKGVQQPEEANASAVAPPGKIDLSQLDPADRERVLRLLFAKINGMQTRISVVPPQKQDSLQQKTDENPESTLVPVS